MAYEALMNEAKDAPEDIIEQTLLFMRFLRASLPGASTANDRRPPHRTVNPLAADFISMADDFDETPDCFAEYV